MYVLLIPLVQLYSTMLKQGDERRQEKNAVHRRLSRMGLGLHGTCPPPPHARSTARRSSPLTLCFDDTLKMRILFLTTP
jgi:hypothetical protein